MQSAQEKRPPTKERRLLLQQMKELQEKNQSLIAELGTYGQCDPARLTSIKKGIDVCRDSANRWTDNCIIMASMMREKCDLSSEELFKQFGIPKDLDNII